MKLSTKLYLSFTVIYFTLFVLLGAMINSIDRQREKTDLIVLERYEKARYSESIRFEISNVGRQLTHALLDYDSNAGLENNLYESNAVITETLDIYRQRANIPGVIEQLTQLRAEYGSYFERGTEALRQARSGNSEQLHELLAELELSRTELFQLTEQLQLLQAEATERAIRDAESAHERAINVIFVALAAGLLLAVLVSILIVRSLSRNVNRVKQVMTGIEFGAEKLPRVENVTKDEVGEIAAAFNAMAGALEEQGRLERTYRQTLEGQHWVKAKLADITAGLQGVQAMHEVSEVFIRFIAEAAQARYGTIYVREPDSSVFRKTASYADTRGPDVIEAGEGLLGQAASDNRLVRIEDAPPDYWTIQSSLGEAKPAAVFIIPVSFEGDVVAVFELAKFSRFDPLHEELLLNAAEGLGAAINRIGAHQRVQQLLHEAQTLTEELQTQSEELQLQQEELKTANDELEAQYKDSERKTIELERIKEDLEEQARQLVLASQYKSEFLANMSHELRTPLNSMLILAQMLVDNPEHNLSEQQVEFAATIFAAGNDLLALINDILDLSKIESGKSELHMEEVALSELAEFVERHFAPIASRHGVGYSVALENNLPGIIYTDELKLRQIVKNLLANAFKFTEQGEVTFRMRLAREDEIASVPGLIKQQPVIAFEVSDTGIGIPRDRQEQIFEAFYQADGTTSRKYGGTGLGLSICRELSQLMGGTIKLDSEVGRGSVFTLYLSGGVQAYTSDSSLSLQEPAAAAMPAPTAGVQTQPSGNAAPRPDRLHAAEGKRTAEAGLAGLSALVVDDDLRNVYALTAQLEAAGMDVKQATNGKDGLRQLTDNPGIDIVLMDMMMPEMDGYETMRAIRAMPAFKELPIIALTAKAMKHDRQRCIDAGASDYISKPLNVEQLLSLLRVWLYR